MLAQAAERTLDVQYYIWRNDLTGTMLFSALRQAADRGVQVRLLLDDNTTAGLDTALAALDSHPNIAVRLFNPFVVRRVRTFGFLTDFSRANRRMHNKSFTADRDPRSAKLNTEMDIVIDSPVLAGRISAAFDQRVPAEAYQVGLSADGRLYWHERRGSKVLRHDVEPGTSAPQRAAVRLMSLLPIDWLL